MLERLRMQEVSQIILTVPEGAVIAGTNLAEGEPVMIIEKPATSKLVFTTRGKTAEDGRGFIGESGQTQSIDFTINEGTILYAVWSYLHGNSKENITNIIKGTEWLKKEDKTNYMRLSTATEPIDLILYKKIDGKLIIMEADKEFRLVRNMENYMYYIELIEDEDTEDYFTVYDYSIPDVQVTTVKQIHNNIFCSMDILFDAIDIDTDDKHTVCVHCDKVQVFTDLAIGVNSSNTTSFTPIVVRSIPEGNELNKNIATITVI